MKRFVTILFFILLIASSGVSAQDIKWVNPFELNMLAVHGQGWPMELSGTYHRLPDRCNGVVREPVWNLSTQSAGLSLVFRSNSPIIKVRYTVSEPFAMTHMAATGVSGVDLYSVDSKGVIRWCGSDATRSFRDTVSYTFDRLSYVEDDGYEFHLYLPLYNQVTWLEIGVAQGFGLEFEPVSEQKPVVIYGTSIAQGACASRPGMVWTNILERDLRMPVVNLGFSGNALMDAEVFDLLSELGACIYVIDAMPNMDGVNEQYIFERTLYGVRKLRESSAAPILLVAHEGYANAPSSELRTKNFSGCNVELERAFKVLEAEGVKDLFFLPHEKNALNTDDMVEGWHPNDLGMRHIATVVEDFIRPILE